MKKTKFLLFVFLSVAPSVVLSQGFSLLSNTSLPRSGDEIVKSQVSFCAPGDIGDSIVWNFQDLEFLNSRQDLFYTGRLDSVLCRYLQGSVYRYTLSQSQDTLLFLGSIGLTEILVLLLIVLLLFGAKKIPELMKSFGKGVKSFKEGVNGIEEDLNVDSSSAKKEPSSANSADSAKNSSAEKK